jgi:cation diffusion facilitator CzcD-associated flavoprotein CzcO
MGSVDSGTQRPFDVKSVAVIGAGPCGLAAANYLKSQPRSTPGAAAPPGQSYYDKITVFEQQPRVGGVWLYSATPPAPTPIPQTSAHAEPDPPVYDGDGDADGAVPIFPSPMYDKLNTNIPHTLMQYSDFPFTDEQGRTAEQGGDLRIFPEREVVLRYLNEYADRAQLRPLIRFSTSVLRVQLCRKSDGMQEEKDQWDISSRNLLTGEEQTETYDAVVVAGGHYNTTYVPEVEGIAAFNQEHPGVISHAKTFRSRETYRDKKVLVVGNSASGLDIAAQINTVSKGSVLVSVQTPTSDEARRHAGFEEVPEIDEFLPGPRRAVRLADGREVEGLDAVLFCTGYLFTFSFFDQDSLLLGNDDDDGDAKEGEKEKEPPLITDGRRVHGLWKHFLHMRHPTLAFPGLPIKVIPFPTSESQAAVCARAWANALVLPPLAEMRDWARREEAEHAAAPHKYHVFPALGDAKYINGMHDWLQQSQGGDGGGQGRLGKEPPYWTPEMFWQRGIYAQARIKFEQDGRKATTLAELGFVYEPDKDDGKDNVQQAAVNSTKPGLDVAG